MRVHIFNIISRWRTKNLNNFYDLITSTFTWKNGHSQHQFSNHAPYRPNINRAIILSISENKLRCSIISRTNIRNIRLPLNQLLCAPKITKLNNMILSIYKYILWFNISVTNPHGMNIRECTQ